MSLKQEIETWVAALAAYDANEFENSLLCFSQIADTSKILFNCGVIHATLGEHTRAVACYQRAVQLDQYLAIAYFQTGVSNFLMGDFEEALANFNDTLLYLRGNNHIDYEQLGLKFKLYSCEVLFNRGLCYIYLQQKDAGLQDLAFATREKMVPDHDVIDEAIREQAEGYTVFSIPVGVVYRPNEAKVKNLKTKNYLGMARLVAGKDQHMHSSDPRRQAALAALGVDDRPGDKLSYAALNLVRPDLRSRSRQQSEPPMTRYVFPPTPPPELERPDSAHGGGGGASTRGERRKSTESTNSDRSTKSNLQQNRPLAKPLRLELGVAAFEHRAAQQQHQQQQQQQQQEHQEHQSQPHPRQRLGTRRAESERPALRREFSGSSTHSTASRRHPQRVASREIPSVRIEEDPIEAYSDAVYHHQRSRSSIKIPPPAPHHQTISEEDEPLSPRSALSPTHTTTSPLAFEIVHPNPPSSSSLARDRPPRRAPSLRKLRVKVHAEDMRYVLTTPATPFADLHAQIRRKFALAGPFRLKIRDDEGDLVTMADQEDWDMAVGICRARGEGEMGKMEVWVVEG